MRNKAVDAGLRSVESCTCKNRDEVIGMKQGVNCISVRIFRQNPPYIYRIAKKSLIDRRFIINATSLKLLSNRVRRAAYFVFVALTFASIYQGSFRYIYNLFTSFRYNLYASICKQPMTNGSSHERRIYFDLIIL